MLTCRNIAFSLDLSLLLLVLSLNYSIDPINGGFKIFLFDFCKPVTKLER